MRTFRACYFNPRSPHGERRAYHTTCDRVADHFNPRSPHGERRQARREEARRRKISIHAPRTGSDADAALRMAAAMQFQSTLPARGATVSLCVRAQAEDDFNPRSPHGERLAQGYQINPTTIFQSTLPARGATFVGQSRGSCSNISIHASRTGSDPLGRIQHHRREISIHAPRTGSDLPERKERRRHCYFNPRSPHGERHRVRDGFPGGQ